MKYYKKSIVINLCMLLLIFIYCSIAINSGLIYGFTGEEFVSMTDSPVFLSGCFFGICYYFVLESFFRLIFDIYAAIRMKLWMKKHMVEIMSDFEDDDIIQSDD